jgi:1-acyl-sn-glycerol-3-phosphate acyltransferase
MDEELNARALRAARTAALGGLMATSLSWMVARERTVPASERAALRSRHARRFFRRCLSLFAVTVLQEGDAPVRDGARLIVSNHRSGLDIPVLGSRFDGAFLSRADLSGWPLVGPAARRIGTLFVDRQDKNSRAGAVKAMRRALKRGEGVLVFPEGTTYPGDDVRPFHAGAFVAAKDLAVQVLPVGLAYESSAQYVEKSFGAHLAKVAALPSVRCALVIGQSRPIGPVQDEPERTRQEVIALVRRARALLDAHKP